MFMVSGAIRKAVSRSPKGLEAAGAEQLGMNLDSGSEFRLHQRALLQELTVSFQGTAACCTPLLINLHQMVCVLKRKEKKKME